MKHPGSQSTLAIDSWPFAGAAQVRHFYQGGETMSIGLNGSPRGLYSQSTPAKDIYRFARAVTDRRHVQKMERNDVQFP